jgi:hypothetical protein
MVTPHDCNVKKMLRSCEAGPLLAIALLVTALVTGCGNKPRQAPQESQSFFEDVTKSAGLSYVWEQPKGKSPLTILETIGNGAAFLDFNQDGNLDILLVSDKTALYTGDGRGAFTDISDTAGLTQIKGKHLGCGVADIDNDGYSDIYLSGYETGHLLRNEAGKRLVNVSAQAGIPAQPFGTAVTFADIDSDGLPELYIGNYIQFDETSIQACQRGAALTSCPPGAYDGISGHLYKNLGNGHFADVTSKWKATLPQGKTLGAAFAPLGNSPGRQSLGIANDEVPGELFRHMGSTFKSTGHQAGIAYSSVGVPHAGMGLDWGDVNNDGLLDLAMMTFSTETKPVYVADKNGIYTDFAAQLGVAAELNPDVAFGVKWLDMDNDGWLDVLVTNGHTADNIAQTGSGEVYRQQMALLRNIEGTRLARIRGAALDKSIVGRGLATGDFDNDGGIDALAVDSAGAPVLLHNVAKNRGHWLGVKLVGTKSGKDASGALVVLKVGERTLTRHCHADGSYLSSSDPRVHFGLGTATAVTKLNIHWPSGTKQNIKVDAIDRYITVEEPK